MLELLSILDKVQILRGASSIPDGREFEALRAKFPISHRVLLIKESQISIDAYMCTFHCGLRIERVVLSLPYVGSGSATRIPARGLTDDARDTLCFGEGARSLLHSAEH